MSEFEKEEEQEQWLFFIDTNILLNFHRSGGESVRKFIDGLQKHKEFLITSEHVKMEYMKNRQAQLLLTYKNFSPVIPQCPPIIVDRKIRAEFSLHQKAIEDTVGKIKNHLVRILDNPNEHDPIYRVLLEIWNTDYEYNLHRPNELRYSIRELAEKRHMLGYPPNDKKTVYLADAYHWEWIIHCAKLDGGSNIIIVSNDDDFGKKFDGELMVNDWLKEEFEDRVGNGKRIELTSTLSSAIKKFNEDDAKEIQKAEEELQHPDTPLDFNLNNAPRQV